MVRILGSTGTRRRRRYQLAAILSATVLLGLLAVPAQGLTQSDFELDKNATNDLTTPHLGVLKSSINASVTAITVCEFTTGVYPPAPPPSFTIMIDSEQMTVNSYGATSTKTGGCSFSDPALVASQTRVYNVTRSAGVSHPGSSDVTQLITGAVAGADWDQVYANIQANADSKCNSSSGGETDLGAVECAWLHDGFGQSVFTTGGSKDDLDINDQGDPAIPEGPWAWTDSSVPPADEILDAFAIKYDHTSTGGDEFLFFGADRFATNGAKDFGFWFFKNKVSTNPDGSFSGVHSVGDILALGTFTQGGAVATIRVFSWVGTGGDTNGVLQTAGQFGDCVPGGGTGPGCSTVNNTTVPSPWAYQGSASNNVPNVIYSGGLLEGGINLSTLGLTGCFSSFMAETRSSPSIGAQLKDFVLGTFEACGATITTHRSDDSFEIGGSVTDDATVHVTGGANPPAPTGFVDFYVCGPTPGITTCDASGVPAGHINLNTAIVSGNDYTVTSDTVTPTVAGAYCFYAEYPAGQDINYAGGAFLTDFSEECFTVTPKQPTISTQVNDENPVPPGTELSDTATLGNTATPSNGMNGTITFKAFGPEADASTCTAPAIYTSVVNVTGDGSYNSADGDGGMFAPTGPGFYNWTAVYAPDAGDVNNLGASTACGEAHEGSIVQQFQPEQTTAQTWKVFDTMTITVAGGGDLLGTAHFALHRTSDCSDAAFFTDNVSVSGPSGTSVSTTTTVDTTFTGDEPILFWNVSYTSDNPSHADIPASCTENSSLDINN